MADYDTSGEMYGQPPKLKGFKGEQAITGAILEVSEEKQNNIYLLGGKGGPELTGPELSELQDLPGAAEPEAGQPHAHERGQDPG